MAQSMRTLPSEFVLAGGAASCATVLSNPFEVVKTRMQVQNELVSRASAQHIQGLIYRNAFQAMGRMVKEEGLLSIQKGLCPSICSQVLITGVRFGSFPTMRGLLTDLQVSGATPIAGMLCGVLGISLGMPFYLLKCQMQAQSDAGHRSLGVVHRARYTSMAAGFRSILAEGGAASLWRGVDAAMMRVAIGSAAQLSTYHLAMENLLHNFPSLKDQRIACSFFSSLLAGVAIVTANHPFDVVTTRMCNQDATARAYASTFACLRLTLAAEGLSGLYKGAFANWCRAGPHTTCCFVFLETFKQVADKRGIFQ